MKFIFSVLLTALLSYAFGLYLPWWSVWLAGFLVSLLLNPGHGEAFLIGFISVALLWGLSVFFISQSNEHILAARFAQLILKSNRVEVLLLATALIGGLVTGLGALSGSLLRRMLPFVQANATSDQPTSDAD